jgi:ABC-type antimicrobial peptide transport system permease subunit
MALLGGILGLIAGFAVGILFTEVIFSNDKSWPDAVPIALAVLGALAGAAAARRVSRRSARPS